MRSSSASGWAPTPRSRTRATSSPGSGSRFPSSSGSRRARPCRSARAVVVIGGGNTAIDVAREALRLGADDVTLVYRRSEAEMPAYPHEVAEARAEGVRFQFLADPVRILGANRARGGRVPADAARRARRERPSSARAGPGGEFALPAETVVKAIGQQPRRELADWIAALELERRPARRRPGDGPDVEPEVLRRRRRDQRRRQRRRGGARRPSELPARSTSGCDERPDRDPLACARRTGREDRLADPRPGAAALRQERPGVPRVRARAPRCAAARVHAQRRPADPPP